MPIPIWKDCPKMDEVINLQDAKELFKASAEIQKFIEYASQNLSKIISSQLYDDIETKGIETGEYGFHINVVEDYAKDYEKDHNCKLHVTEHVLESIAFRIGEIFREHGFYAGGHLSYSCANIKIQGWGEEFDR